MAVWIYTINPSAPQGYDYGWTLSKPETLLASTDKVWPTHNYFRQIAPRDQIAVYMKNTGAVTGDGIYILGTVLSVDEPAREFTWRPDITRTRALVDAPIPTDVVRYFFGRGYGGAMRRLEPDLANEWKRLIDGLVKRHAGT